MRPTARPIVALALTTVAACASDRASLVDLPVAGAARVPASQYAEATARAPRDGSPVDIAMSIVGAFEGARQVIVQTNEAAESPSASRVTVVRDGLLDDAIGAERWDIALARTAAGRWEVREVTRSWRCRRGGDAAGFATKTCP